jgi:hypothetical protein
MACLFAGLMLAARLLRILGLVAPAAAPGEDPAPPRPKGGKRAAR